MLHRVTVFLISLVVMNTYHFCMHTSKIMPVFSLAHAAAVHCQSREKAHAAFHALALLGSLFDFSVPPSRPISAMLTKRPRKHVIRAHNRYQKCRAASMRLSKGGYYGRSKDTRFEEAPRLRTEAGSTRCVQSHAEQTRSPAVPVTYATTTAPLRRPKLMPAPTFCCL